MTFTQARAGRFFISIGVLIFIAQRCLAAPAANPATNLDSAPANRFGPGGLFDSRSLYGKGFYPEPFLVDDSDLEVNEIRLDWLHQETSGQVNNLARAELEKGFGLMTIEFEVPYEYNTSRQFDLVTRQSRFTRIHGFDNINLGARNPFFQFVSNDQTIDLTLGAAIEVGIPTNSPLSKNGEIVPKLFNDLRIGDHLSIQTVLGYSLLIGPHPDGGTQTFEYGLVFGWTFQHSELPLPDVQQFVPMFELRGDTLLNTDAVGANRLLADAAFRVDLRSIGPVQPRLGVGYVFPLDHGARQDTRWGIYTSLVFEF